MAIKTETKIHDFRINSLSAEAYNEALANEQISEDELYLTEEELTPEQIINHINMSEQTYKVKTYTTLEQLGLSTGSETIESILTAMPVNSILQLTVGANHANIYPTQYGMFVARKNDTSRFFAEFYPKETSDLYVCSAKIENSTFALYEWKKKADTSDIDDLKKSVSDGKTLVANAITAKGVTTATDATFQTMADNIALIESGIPGISSMYSVVDSFVVNGTKTQEYVSGLRWRTRLKAFEQSVTSDSEIDMIVIVLTGGSLPGVSTTIIIPSYLTYGYFIENEEKTARTNSTTEGTIPLNTLLFPNLSVDSSNCYGVLSSDKKTFTLSLTTDVIFVSNGSTSSVVPKLYLYAYSLSNESTIEDSIA